MEIVVEDYVPYEENVRWRVHDAWFAQSGLRPWTERQIPQETTNGQATALQQARLLIAAAATAPPGPLHVLEVGGGAGGFVVNLMDALEHDCGPAGIALLRRLHYTLTDYQARTVTEAAASERLARLIASGRLDVQQLDVREPFQWVGPPLFAVFANYVACATPAPWVQKKGERYFRCFVQTRAEIEASGDVSAEALVQSFLDEATADGLLDRLTYYVDWRPEPLDAVGGAPADGRIIARCLEGVDEATLCYPRVFLGFLEAVRTALAPNGVIVVNDLGRCDVDSLRGLKMPTYRHYGNTVNHPIHTRIYASWAAEVGMAFRGSGDPLAPLQQVLLVNAPGFSDTLAAAFDAHVVDRSELTDFLDFIEAAQLSSQSGDGERAIRLLRRCLPLERRTARLRYQLAELCAQHGKSGLALQYIDEARQMPDAADYDFDFLLGRVHADQGDRAAAIAAFERSLQRGPHEITWSNLGELHAEAGDLEQAYHCWRKTLELDPAHERAASRLEWLREAFWAREQAALDERFGLTRESAPEEGHDQVGYGHEEHDG